MSDNLKNDLIAINERLDKLEEKLEEYRNERTFVFTHLFFPEKAGNFNNRVESEKKSFLQKIGINLLLYFSVIGIITLTNEL